MAQNRKSVGRQTSGEPSPARQRYQSEAEGIAAAAPWQAVGSGSSVGSSSQALVEGLATTTRSLDNLQLTQQSAAEITTENTQALLQKATGTATSVAGNMASALSGGGGLVQSLLSGGGLLGPVLSGIANLFDSGGSSAPPPRPVYKLPPAIQVDAVGGQSTGGQVTAGNQGTNGFARQQPPSTNITVQVNAMDSRSFLNRQTDIAAAVRQAILSSHNVSDVIAEL